MEILGFEIKRKATPPNLSPPTTGWSGSAWWPVIRESFAGAWQQNVEIRAESVLAYHAVFACITLISNDIGKLRFKLVEKNGSTGIWDEIESAAFSPVLRRPNHYQNPIQFRETWTTSKLRSGNTYVLKERDDRGIVIALHVLDPGRCKPLISPDGLVFYEVQPDNLSDVREAVVIPQSEIIHDRINCLFHPLVGLSPIYACGLAATQGLAAQGNATQFFQNMSRPGGILVAPGPLPPAKAAAMKDQWDSSFGGANAGKIAVLADGLKYQALAMTAQESQMIENLKWTAEVVCSCFHVPAFKLGLGATPAYQNAEVLNQIYYSDCLQSLIEQMEACMDEGLGLTSPKDGRWLGTELDLDDLLRMDTATQVKTLADAVGGAILTPNEARMKVNKKPLKGGNTVYLQQQQFSIAALDERDQADPFAKPATPAPALPAPAADGATPADETMQLMLPLMSRIEALESKKTDAEVMADVIVRGLAVAA